MAGTEQRVRALELEVQKVKGHGETCDGERKAIWEKVDRLNLILVGNGTQGLLSKTDQLLSDSKANRLEHREIKASIEVMDRKLSGRPSWSVALIITGLFGLCMTLLTILATQRVGSPT